MTCAAELISRPSKWIVRISACFVAALAIAATNPAAGLAQTTVSVFGAVVDATQGTPVPGATVELEGYGPTLTLNDGSYRFTGVELGTYLLRVAAYGYSPSTRVIVVAADLSIEV